MAKVGLVFYEDDPDRKIFRRILLSPGETEAEFDNPDFVTLGCDPTRTAVLIKVDAATVDEYDLTGVP